MMAMFAIFRLDHGRATEVSKKQVSSDGVGLTMRVRSNFAVNHLIAAALFARKTAEIERLHTGTDLNPFFDEIMSYVSASILCAVAGLETYINELFLDADTCFPEYQEGAAGEL